jgi:hypothetical protein
MTLREFAGVFAVLSVQLTFEADEPTIRGYYESMKDLELEFVRWAAEGFGRVGDGWFPKAPVWRTAALKVEADRTEELKALLRKRTKPLCLACGDTTWARDETTNAVKRCDCAKLRRLEILGRRPMPALTNGSERTVQVDAEAVARALAIASVMP